MKKKYLSEDLSDSYIDGKRRNESRDYERKKRK